MHHRRPPMGFARLLTLVGVPIVSIGCVHASNSSPAPLEDGGGDGAALAPDSGTRDASSYADAAPLDASNDTGRAEDGGGKDGSADASLVCDGGLSVCAASCVDESNDPHNCGACGFTCPGGCSSGVCELLPTTIALGWDYACAIVDGGTVKCWGGNEYGQLGANTSGDASAPPVPVGGLTGATSIAAGPYYACAVVDGGSVMCWGDNAANELGSDAAAASPTATFVPGLASVVQLAAGNTNLCAIVASGAVLCLGDNRYGELGMPVGGSSAAPVEIPAARGASRIGAGIDFACAVIPDGGKVSCWGSNVLGQLGVPLADAAVPTPSEVPGVSGAVDIAADQFHACALLSDGGMVACWGYNANGLLGSDAGTLGNVGAPPFIVAGIRDAVALRAGNLSNCALLSDASVACWGQQGGGSLGHPADGTYPPAPFPLSGPATEVAPGYTDTCARLVTGEVVCAGANTTEELGRSLLVRSSSPVAVLGVADASSVAAGLDHACAIVGGGNVLCWGDNSNGQLGTEGGNANVAPAAVPGLSGPFVSVASGGGQSCALTPSGAVTCWGNNSRGELGNGDDASISAAMTGPESVVGLHGASEIVAGLDHTCALTDAGAIACWGDNSDGELGVGDAGPSQVNAATPVLFDGGFVSVSAGLNATCGLTMAHALYCWGDDSSAELGLGTIQASTVLPAEVQFDGGFAAVAIGAEHSCAIAVGGQVYCWGDNSYGELGNSTPGTAATPVLANGVTTAQSIAVGQDFSCALLANGTVQCWGANSSGMLGGGSSLPWSAAPVTIAGLSDVVGLSAFAYGLFACAVTGDGRVYCWGDDTYGNLGDGPLLQSSTPLTISGL